MAPLRGAWFESTTLNAWLNINSFGYARFSLALPEVTEPLSHGAPYFFFCVKQPLCYFHDAKFEHRWVPSTRPAARTSHPTDSGVVGVMEGG